MLAIPIIALTVREHESRAERERSTGATRRPTTRRTGGKKKEREGVFVVRDGIATFRPVKVGIAGDEYFEVLDGLKAGETIVAGTYQAIRDLKDGAKVKEGEGAGHEEGGEALMSEPDHPDPRPHPPLRHGQRRPSTRCAASRSTSGATSTWRSWGRRARASPR